MKLIQILLLFLIIFFGRTTYAEEKGVPIDIRLMGADLVDELVHDWELKPAFSASTLTALTEIEAPVGLDDRFNTLIENHLVELLLEHQASHIRLARCSACQKLIVKSNRAGTYIGRGIDQPELLKDLASSGGAKVGLSLSFEAEGQSLVLRAQLFSFTELGQPILWARSYTTKTSSRLALQDPHHLMTLEEARRVQNDIIHHQDPLQFVSRVTMRMFTPSNSGGSLTTGSLAPLLFAEQSIEGILLPRRNMRMALTVGATSIEKTMGGYSAGGHVAHLISGKEPSLANPDLYFFWGFQYIRIRGPAAAQFAGEQFDVAKLLGDKTEPRAAFVAYRIGIELHAKNRLGVLAFLENIPSLDNSNIIKKDTFIGIPYHDLGVGVVVRW